LSLLEEVMVAAVGLLRRGEARELAHGPELAAVHVGVDAAGVRELAGRRRLRDVFGPVQRLDRHSADCRKLAFDGFHFVPGYRYLNPARHHFAVVMMKVLTYAHTHNLS